MNKFIRVLIFNVIIVVLLVLIFSPRLLGISMQGGAAEAALGVTVIFLAIVIVIWGNLKLQGNSKETPAQRQSKYQTLDECIFAVNAYLREESKVFSIALNQMIDQLRRMKRKQDSFTEILQQKFSATEMSYVKFHSVISESEKLMRAGVRSVITRLRAFDEDEYKRAVSSPRSDRVTEAKRELFKEYETHIGNTLEHNEDILLKLDRLVLELSKLTDSSDVDNLNALDEIDALIQSAKWYK
ncbi:MAG: hypothetical protein LBL96_06920 [Clostridiales bacterium]|nr:hypothetical protein [Clostridiales bacterium]